MLETFHLCFVESGYPHPHGGGGAGTYVQLIGRELARQGHRISVVASCCSQCPPVVQDDRVTVYRPKLKGNWHWYLSKIPGLRVGALALRTLEQGWQLALFLERLHRQNSIDLVEFTEGGDFWHAFQPTFPYIVHLHGSRYTFRRMSGEGISRADWYHRCLELIFIRRACLVLSPSQALLSRVEDEAGQSLTGAAVIPYPLDPGLDRNTLPLNVKRSVGKVVHFAARNDPVKGGYILLQAVPLVQKAVPEVEFRFFGYKAAAPAHPLPGIKWYDFLPKQELLQYYQQADLCVIPSLWDNSPNTVYEAMAAGKAVVATRVGGIPELVSDGQTGLLVSPGDLQQLAAAIIELLQNDQKRLAMGQQGQERIRQLADLSVNVEQRCAIYRQVVNDSG